MSRQPPKWVLQFLEWTCSPKYLDELQGDLLELFDRDVSEGGPSFAKRRLIVKALLSPRWYRLPKLNQLQPGIMYKSHFKVAFRHARRHQSAATVQILGLILGIAAAFFIGLFILNELAFDQMHENNEQLYRVLRYDPTNGDRSMATSSLHGSLLKEAFPFTQMCRYGHDPVKMGEIQPILVEDFYWADSTFFAVFSFDFIAGNPRTCLDVVNSVVITSSLSKQLFGSTNAVGRTIPVKVYDGDQEFPMRITAVIKDPPTNTHVQFKALGSMANAESLYKNLLNQWGFSWLRTYLLIPPSRYAEIQAGLPAVIKKSMGNDVPPSFGMTFQPFNRIYLHSQDMPKNTLRGNIRNIRIFGAIGILVLLISLLNYINLATARAAIRVKEVGIRKTLGSSRSGILSQFVVESVVFMVGSGFIAILLILGTLPQLNTFFDLHVSAAVLSWKDFLLLALMLFGLGITAGILPAFVLSNLPGLSLNSATIRFKSDNWSLTRKVFVGIQYTVTLVLLVSTFAIYQQYRYLRDFDLGFNTEQLLHIPVNDRQLQQKLPLLKEQIGALSGVTGVCATGEDLPSELNNTWGISWSGANPEEPLGIDIIGVDQDYFELLKIPFIEGRNFPESYEVDSARSVILNEKARSMINRDAIVGSQVQIGGRDRKVVGVVEDSHNTSLHSEIVPIAYLIFPPGFRVSPDNLLVRLKANDAANLLAELKTIWGQHSSDPLLYNFVDEAFAAAYSSEKQFSTLIFAFTLFAIIISIVGLFGLISFIVQLKLKEISIRRVLGAQSLDLMQHLGRDFFIVYGIAVVLAIPVALRLINTWLTGYAYRIQVHHSLLWMAALLCLLTSVLVIFYHLRNATKISPSEYLSE